MQIIFCLLTAVFLGLSFTISVLLMVGVLIVISLLYIGFGLIVTDKQVGGIFAIFVNLSTWFSGTWFEPNMIGGTFQSVTQFLPFVHAVHAARAILSGAYSDVYMPLAIVLGYTVFIFMMATLLFQRKMRGQI